MSSTYSPSLRIQLIETGTENEAWGQPLDNNLGTIIEQAITGVESISLTNLTSYTLTNANAVADQSRNAVLVFTGSLTADCNVVAPTVNKVYVISNQTTGGKSVNITVGSGSNVAVANGTNQLVYCNGSSFKSAVDVNSIIGNLDVSGSSTVGANVTVGTTLSLASSITGTSGNLKLNSTSSNIINFNGSAGALIPPYGTTAQRPAVPVNGMSRWNTTLGWYEIWNGIIWQQITGSFAVNYLIVAGGGGGGANSFEGGGGGGAGGLLANAATLTAGASYTVTVGSGGAVNAPGTNSALFGFTAVGGGAGAGSSPYINGGSGGGKNTRDNPDENYGPGSGTAGQGYSGSSGIAGYVGAGGGGASQPGQNTAGGNGLASLITGTSVIYAGGGGGGNRQAASGGAGGAGGGGSNGVAGAAYKGSGGAGGGSDPGAYSASSGGSGVVILSYEGTIQRATGGTVTSYSTGGTTYWVHTFTTSGTFAT